MNRIVVVMLALLVFLGVLGLLFADFSYAWGGGGGGWGGGGGGGGWRPPRDRPPSGGGGGGGATPPATPPGGAGPRPGGPAGGAGPDGPTGNESELEMNQEFDFEFIEDKEVDFHRQSMASLFANRD